MWSNGFASRQINEYCLDICHMILKLWQSPARLHSTSLIRSLGSSSILNPYAYVHRLMRQRPMWWQWQLCSGWWVDHSWYRLLDRRRLDIYYVSEMYVNCNQPSGCRTPLLLKATVNVPLRLQPSTHTHPVTWPFLTDTHFVSNYRTNMTQANPAGVISGNDLYNRLIAVCCLHMAVYKWLSY